MSDIRFGVGTYHNKLEIEESRFDVVQRGKETAAAEMGRKIMEAKGWREEPMGDDIYYTQDVYVFTAKELRLFVRSKGGLM